ncbi:MAG: hypothetical protein HYZ86_04040 [Candidatus Omnitrophica bacterium]|nr:hypothetical protein [Candidatus Omnitrophota bacterium]
MNQRVLTFTLFFTALCLPGLALAQAQGGDPVSVVSDFSTQAIAILKGPIAKTLAALVLLAGVGGLLRGRHKLALSCGAAFVILLFLPILLEQVANGH